MQKVFISLFVWILWCVHKLCATCKYPKNDANTGQTLILQNIHEPESFSKQCKSSIQNILIQFKSPLTADASTFG